MVVKAGKEKIFSNFLLTYDLEANRSYYYIISEYALESLKNCTLCLVGGTVDPGTLPSTQETPSSGPGTPSSGSGTDSNAPAPHVHTWGDWITVAPATVMAPATQTRTCSACGVSESQTLSGSQLAPVLKLTANKLTMKKGQTTTKFKVEEMAAGDSLVSVNSSDKKTLKVSNVKPNGTFKLKALKETGKKKVKLTITLASGATKTVKVTVQSAAVKTTKVKAEKKLTLKAKEKADLKPVITPVTSQDKVNYKSSNTKVATVNAKGVVTAKKPGKAKITIQSGGKKATCAVAVTK